MAAPGPRALLCLCAGAVAALALSGCIQLEQTLMLNGDGSLTMRWHYSIAADSEPLLATGADILREWQGREPVPGGPAWFTSEEAIRRHFAAAGVTVQKYDSYLAEGRRHVEVQLFAERGVAVLNGGLLGPLRCDRRPDGRLRLWVELPPVPARPAGFDTRTLSALCQDLYLRLEVRVPGQIVETTAPVRRRGAAVWELDPAKDASFLESPPRIECVFDAARLDWAATVPPAPP